jgi:hypothetical protein
VWDGLLETLVELGLTDDWQHHGSRQLETSARTGSRAAHATAVVEVGSIAQPCLMGGYSLK